MKEIFEELEAEVGQNVMDRKCDEIERKNLLIANEILIVDCLSKDVFYTTTTSMLTVSRFSYMHNAYIVKQARCLELEAKISKLKHKIQKDDHSEMIKHFSNLELKWESKGSDNRKIKCVTMDSIKPKVLAPSMYAIDVEPIPPRNRNNKEVHLDYLKHLKESIKTLREIVEEVRIEKPLDNALGNACFYTKRSQELLEQLKTYDGELLTAYGFHEKFIRTVRFGNDHFGAIMGYGDYVIGDSVISRVYYVEGLRHNLFSKWQFCDSDLEVAFKFFLCYIRNEDGVELLKGSWGSNMYTIFVEDMMKSSLICLLSKASKNKSWLWHRRLNHLNFGTINDLARKDLVRGLPRLKFEKDHLCSACQLGKSKKYTHKPKSENTIMEFLHTLHMDLCGPIRVQSINGKKYILVINDVVKRQNRTLVEADQIMMIFSKALMVLWAEVVATACYTQNRSLIHTHHNKTPYEHVHDKKPDLKFL
ncbi:retrovirus-related pol polyprotein from transposon TNT 1-94 [Tanacetum coccineum]